MNKPPQRIFLSPPHMGGREMAYLQNAFDSNYIAPLGPMVDAFENDLSRHSGIPGVLAVSSGTAAMHLVLRCLGIGAGDTVYSSTLTFIGSVEPVCYLGATPVFLDSDPATWNLDPDLLEEALAEDRRNNRLPKAVIATDLYGQCCDYDRLQAVCAEYDIPLIIDAAEAMGARYKERHAGHGGYAAVFSFNGNKIITTSGGGALASGDRAMMDRARKLSQQAREPRPYYEHVEIGYNYRMSNLLAAVGRGQLEVLEERVRQKRALFEYYRAGLKDLPGLSLMPEAPYGRSNRWLSVILVDATVAGVEPEQVRQLLEQANIEARPVWKPMHRQPVFAECPRYRGTVAETLFRQGLCLPSGTAMEKADLDRIIELIRGIWKGGR